MVKTKLSLGPVVRAMTEAEAAKRQLQTEKSARRKDLENVMAGGMPHPWYHQKT